MKIIAIELLEKYYQNNKEISLFGKWITFNNIKDLLKKYDTFFEVSQIGTSENGNPILQLKIGTGKKKILIWSQMHGNESTGTKALFDVLNCFLQNNTNEFSTIVKECTLIFIPMLNPDGAQAYTRVNANNIDLNRDAVDRLAKESTILRNVLETFKPKFCFNLHDQRTIFGVEGTKNTATISFLAPSEEETRAITEGRKQTMNVIVAMNTLLQQIIPGNVGRYTDEFYPTATGDNFQKLGYNTILIESGHYSNDYNREESRKFTFYSMVQGLYHIATTSNFNTYKAYFDIPNNKELFFDVIHRYTDAKNDKAYQYVDKIIENKLVATLVEIEQTSLKDKIGHCEIVFDSLKN